VATLATPDTILRWYRELVAASMTTAEARTWGIVDFDIFLVAEDTDNIVISERVRRQLAEKRYPDVYFEELRQV
jgi:hypothetical protein